MKKELKTKDDIRRAVMQGKKILNDFGDEIILLNPCGNIEITQDVAVAIDTFINAIHKSGGHKFIEVNYKKRYVVSVEQLIDLLKQGKEIVKEDYDDIIYKMKNGIIYATCTKKDFNNINIDVCIINPEITFERSKFYYKELK